MSRFAACSPSWPALRLPFLRPPGTAQHRQTTHITLGQSVVPLYGPWKFSVGDSPLDPATGGPLWAQPGFDDSKWETVDLYTQGRGL